MRFAPFFALALFAACSAEQASSSSSLTREPGACGQIETHVIGVYEAHVEHVKAALPKSRLLVFEAKDGWEPLCRFLDVDVPDEPYPRVNTTDDFMNRLGQLRSQNP